MNPQPFSLQTNTQPFSQTGQMTELCCGKLSVYYIWLIVITMSCIHFRVNLNSIVVWMSRNSLLETDTMVANFPVSYYLPFFCTYPASWTIKNRQETKNNYVAQLGTWYYAFMVIILESSIFIYLTKRKSLYWKSSFFWDFHIFVLSSSLPFLPVSHF